MNDESFGSFDEKEGSLLLNTPKILDLQIYVRSYPISFHLLKTVQHAYVHDTANFLLFDFSISKLTTIVVPTIANDEDIEQLQQ